MEITVKTIQRLDENHFEIKVKKFSVSEVNQSPSQLKSVKEGLKKKIFINNVFSEPGVWKKRE